jgi:hypothetical protein
MKTILKNIFLFVLLSTCSAYSQTAPVKDSLLDNMVGKWILQGTIAGQETTHDIIADWVLGHQYVQLRETSHEKDSSDKPSYEAIIFITWEQALNQYTCLWLDNTGNGGLKAQAIGHADRNGDNIGFIFKISAGSTFNTTFSYDKSSDSWQWNMESRENDKIQPFARVKLTKENKIK